MHSYGKTARIRSIEFSLKIAPWLGTAVLTLFSIYASVLAKTFAAHFATFSHCRHLIADSKIPAASWEGVAVYHTPHEIVRTLMQFFLVFQTNQAGLHAVAAWHVCLAPTSGIAAQR